MWVDMNKILKSLIFISILAVPMSSAISMPGTNVWWPQLITLEFIGLLTIALMLWETNRFIAIFMAYSVFSYFFVANQSPRSLICLMSGFSGMFLMLAISRQGSVTFIRKGVLIMIAIMFVYVIFQAFNVDPFFHFSSITGEQDWNKTDIVGFSGSHNQLGAWFASVGILLYSINPIFIAFAVIPILLAHCITALFGIGFGIASYNAIIGKWKVGILIISFLIALSIPTISITQKFGEIKERVQVWKLSLAQIYKGVVRVKTTENVFKFIEASPWFGFGIGNFFVFSPLSQDCFTWSPWHRYEHAHNDLIEAVFEYGYVGFTLLILCILSIFFDFIEALHSSYPDIKNLSIAFSSLIGLAVTSCGIYIVHAPLSWFMFCVFLGLFYWEINNAKQIKINPFTAKTIAGTEVA